jgi:hypothetical protein
LSDAARWCKLKSSTSIWNNLSMGTKSAGKHPVTGEPLHWMYYDEYIKQYGEIKTKTA